MDLIVARVRSARLALLGAASAGISGWFDWVELGTRRRSSYAMFRSLQVLGLDVLDPIRVLWWWMPVLAIAVACLHLGARPRIAAIPAAVLAFVVGAAAVATIAVGVGGGIGPWVGLVGGTLLIVGTVTTVQVRP